MIALGIRLTLRSWKRMLLVSAGLAVALLFYGYYQITLARIAQTAVEMAGPPPMPGEAMVRFADGIELDQYQYDFSALRDVTGYFAVSESTFALVGRESPATLLALDMQLPLLDLQAALKSGRLPEAPDEVCVTDEAATEEGLALGDIMQDDAERRLTVVGVLRSQSALPLPLIVQEPVLFTQNATPETVHYAFLYFPNSKNSAVTWALNGKYAHRHDVIVYSLLSTEEMGMDTRTLSEGLVSKMSTLLVFTVGAFLANMQLVGLLNKRKETQALKAVGLSFGQILLFPVLDALWAGLVAVPLFLLGWQFALPAIVNEPLSITDPLAMQAAALGMAVCLAAGLLAGSVNSQGQFAD